MGNKQRITDVRAPGKGKAKSQLQDDSIMGTNSSSIVSKRSVERLYFPQEPHYFRFFVKKPQRRSPLINRGYWLRMKAIDHVVHQFLKSSSQKQKVVINLGCGYDPLPWQCLSRYPTAAKNTKFIDIDYKDLMLKKREVVQNTSELHSMLTNPDASIADDVLFRSDQYVQLGCDLRDLPHLNQTLSQVLDIDNSLILLTAEVSITYMKVEESDALIKWASMLPEARFCLLEQILPEGIDYPFAKTMMAHFAKLQTPLGAVEKYPTTVSQKQRFTNLGWANISVRNLWNLWSSPDFLTTEERLSLDIEAFDEWEEFAIFGSHYFLLTAENLKTDADVEHTLLPLRAEKGHEVSFITPQVKIAYYENPKLQGIRRFAAPLPISELRRTVDAAANFGGMGLSTRVNSYDVYSGRPEFLEMDRLKSDNWPSVRMCHTITDLGNAGALLVGGRISPDKALKDCWLYHKFLSHWERVDDLPQPLYRHSAVAIGDDSILVCSGKSSSRKIEDQFLIWNRQFGWRSCVIEGQIPCATYGATFFKLSHDAYSSPSGILAGGLSNEGILQQDVWSWNLKEENSMKPTICFSSLREISNDTMANISIARFGATTICHGGINYVLGGIIRNEALGASDEICIFEVTESEPTVGISSPIEISLNPRPLLIGTSVASIDGVLLIMGGGAVCFSFGTYWNIGCYTVDLPEKCFESETKFKYRETCLPVAQGSKTPSVVRSSPRAAIPVSRMKIRSSNEFNKILASNKPIILEGMDLGCCLEKWTTAYLKQQIGPLKQVIVHEASSVHMNFKSKNYRYIKIPFGEFIDRAERGERLYMRSLSADKPSEIPADIHKDFPSIASDFQLPPELNVITETFHSSPLRIGGEVNMWLHYDVMANVLCQIKGSKRLLLFPPSDVTQFNLEPGSSSSDINVFENMGDELLINTHPHEAILSPGDVLFLPQLWLHTASPTSGISVAVNVFFQGLQSARYAVGKDVYGNRDLQAYEKGRQDVAKIVKAFETLPDDVRGFYLSRLAREFNQNV